MTGQIKARAFLFEFHHTNPAVLMTILTATYLTKLHSPVIKLYMFNASSKFWGG